MKISKTLILTGILSLIGGNLVADTIEDVDFYEAGGNFYCYPWLNNEPPRETPAPEGYEPFHLEHYGRHGSRWHIGNYTYEHPYKLLKKGHDQGKLTDLGEEVFETVSVIRENFNRGRDGELSDKGAWQHQGIGRRLAKRYPEIFHPNSSIDARSTIIIRSILSMFNGLSGIQSVAPQITITTDASNADMWYMNYYDKEALRMEFLADSLYLDSFRARHWNKGEYLDKLFNDKEYARDSIGESLFSPLFILLANTQSHSDQPWLVDKVFTEEEVREEWLCRNASWFFQGGNSKLTENRMPYSQANLLANIIENTDSAINSAGQTANLRYGHDTIIMPLTCLLELNNFGEEINDLEELAAKGWHDYKIVPMGANIQIVFYRPKSNEVSSPEDVLVKVFLNEEECTLPLDRQSGPYYKWTDFKNYYLNKITPYVNSPV